MAQEHGVHGLGGDRPDRKDTIPDALDLMKQVTIEKRSKDQDTIHSRTALREQVRASLGGLDGMIEDLQKRITFLDTKDLELQGADQQSFERKGVQRTVDFKFFLETKYPIRHVTDTKPASSTWLDLPSYPDSPSRYTFLATLKNKRFSSATAKVELYGWRREIHATELADSRETLKLLNQERAEWHKAFEEHTKSIEKQIAEVEISTGQLASIFWDRNTLESPGPVRPDGTTVENLYLLCERYGLTSAIERSRLSSTLQEKCQYKDSLAHLDRLKGLHETTRRRLRALLDEHTIFGKDISLNTSRFTSLTKNAFRSLDRSESDRLKSLAKDSPESTVAKEALADIAKLDKSYETFASTHTQKFNELHDVRRKSPDMSDFECTIPDIVDDNAKDIQALETTTALLKDTHIGVAVAACLMAADSAIEGWVEVLDGVREKLDPPTEVPALLTIVDDGQGGDLQNGADECYSVPSAGKGKAKMIEVHVKSLGTDLVAPI